MDGLMSPTVSQLISSPPGDGISVTQSDGRTRVHIRAGISQKAGCYGVLLVAVCCPIVLVASSVGLFLWEFSDQPNWWAIGLCAIVALAGAVPAIAAVTMLVLPLGIRGYMEITRDGVRIDDRGRVVELAWEDINSVRVLYMRRPGLQLHAKKDWPWLRGRGDGIALDTPRSTFKTLDWWHHEVSQWLARLLSELGTVTLTDDQGLEPPVWKGPISHGTSGRTSRKDLAILGSCALLLGGFFSWAFWTPVRDSWGAREWKSVEAVVAAIDSVKPDEGRSRLVVTYHYEVQGIAYTNDRFRIEDAHSARAERRKADLVVGNPIEIWYDPDDPQRSCVERDFAFFSFSAFLISSGIGLAGIAVLIHAALRRKRGGHSTFLPGNGPET
jgi:hypothetical protein